MALKRPRRPGQQLEVVQLLLRTRRRQHNLQRVHGDGDGYRVDKNGPVAPPGEPGQGGPQMAAEPGRAAPVALRAVVLKAEGGLACFRGEHRGVLLEPVFGVCLYRPKTVS